MDKFTKASFVVLFVLLIISFGFNILYVVKDKYDELSKIVDSLRIKM